MSRGPGASAVFHRDPRHAYPVAVAGDGPYLIDATGKRYLDGSGGAAVSCLGHDDAGIVAAIEAQLRRLPYNADLTAHAPAGIAKAYFVSGGSEAIEAALKLGRQYFLEAGSHKGRE